MKQTIVVICLTLVTTASAISAIDTGPGANKPTMVDAEVDAFWERFREAVRKENKPAVAGLTKFPIGMPYGMASVRNRAQLIRRYRDVFNHEGSAASKCFETAKPVSDPTRPKEFTVGCKNSAGDEVIIYHFQRTPVGWRFTALDNINE